MNKKFLILFLLLVFCVTPIFVFAQEQGDDARGGGAAGGGGPTIASMAESIAKQVIIVGTWIVVIMWVVTGILFLTAQGDPGKLNAAKTSLFTAIGGTILIILANGAIGFVKNSFGL